MSDTISRVTQDFIFGTMATDELRLDALRAEARGVSHRSRTVPLDPRPDEPVELLIDIGPDVDAIAVDAFVTFDGSCPTTASTEIAFRRQAVTWDTILWAYRQQWQAVIPPQPAETLVRYRIRARDAGGGDVWADRDPWTGEAATFGVHIDDERLPAWVRDAVIYHLFVDRFAPGPGRDWQRPDDLAGIWGGTLRGVIEELPYLASLGITCLWLSPVFPSPSHHGYDATDYLHVEPRLGSDNDLVELFAAAHDLGLRVLLDFVANHVSSDHPAFRRAIASPTAPEREWFTFREWPTDYRSFFGVPTLPQINLDHPAARGYVLNAASHWLKKGADGFRLDYANGPSHDFWAAFRAETRQANLTSFTVGEVVETADLQVSYQGRLDGTLDFLLLQQLRAFFAFDLTSPAQFDAFLQSHLAMFPASGDFVLPSFLDNHDMNRFLWVAGGELRRLKLAALCQFTLPHPPIVYYGTEVGLSQWRDLEYPDGSRRMEESRTPMLWGGDQDLALRSFYQRLIAVRRDNPNLWRGERSTLTARDDCYVVTIEAAGERAIVALNRGQRKQHIDVPARMSLALSTIDSLFDGGREVVIPPLGGLLLLSD